MLVFNYTSKTHFIHSFTLSFSFVIATKDIYYNYNVPIAVRDWSSPRHDLFYKNFLSFFCIWKPECNEEFLTFRMFDVAFTGIKFSLQWFNINSWLATIYLWRTQSSTKCKYLISSFLLWWKHLTIVFLKKGSLVTENGIQIMLSSSGSFAFYIDF